MATEKSYLGWLRQYLRFYGTPDYWTLDWNSREGVELFLEYLVIHRRVNASTQIRLSTLWCFSSKRF